MSTCKVHAVHAVYARVHAVHGPVHAVHAVHAKVHAKSTCSTCNNCSTCSTCSVASSTCSTCSSCFCQYMQYMLKHMLACKFAIDNHQTTHYNAFPLRCTFCCLRLVGHYELYRCQIEMNPLEIDEYGAFSCATL